MPASYASLISYVGVTPRAGMANNEKDDRMIAAVNSILKSRCLRKYGCVRFNSRSSLSLFFTRHSGSLRLYYTIHVGVVSSGNIWVRAKGAESLDSAPLFYSVSSVSSTRQISDIFCRRMRRIANATMTPIDRITTKAASMTSTAPPPALSASGMKAS